MSHCVDSEYSVYNEKTLKARKAHECDACPRHIEPGDYYARIYILFDGAAETVKRCGSCQKTHEHLRTLDPGEMWPDERLACGTEYLDEWGKEPPAEVQAWAFATDGDAGQLLSPLARLREWVGEAEYRMQRKDRVQYPCARCGGVIGPSYMIGIIHGTTYWCPCKREN